MFPAQARDLVWIQAVDEEEKREDANTRSSIPKGRIRVAERGQSMGSCRYNVTLEAAEGIGEFRDGSIGENGIPWDDSSCDQSWELPPRCLRFGRIGGGFLLRFSYADLNHGPRHPEWKVPLTNQLQQ